MNDLCGHISRLRGAGGGFRVGLVEECDAARARVRVLFPDYDELTSWWLPLVFAKTQNDKAYWMPDVGEQVVCLMDSRDEAGAVLGAIYSEADTTPVASADQCHVTFRDGASFNYDRSAHVFDLKFQDAAEIRYDAGEHALAVALPSGASMSITANGATISIDGQGDVAVTSPGQIRLGGIGPSVARIGDTVACPAGTGHITSGSALVQSA